MDTEQMTMPMEVAATTAGAVEHGTARPRNCKPTMPWYWKYPYPVTRAKDVPRAKDVVECTLPKIESRRQLEVYYGQAKDLFEGLAARFAGSGPEVERVRKSGEERLNVAVAAGIVAQLKSLLSEEQEERFHQEELGV